MVALTNQKQNNKNLSIAGLKAFFKIAELWDLSSEEQINLLGSPSRSTFFNWKKSPSENLTIDTLERLSCILGIYKALQILLPTPQSADKWIKTPNMASLFSGKSALDFITSSGRLSDLLRLREYLDSQRGGGV